MEKHVVFKKGQKVKITRGMNASNFNTKQEWSILGAYSLEDWESKEFEIEGTVKLITFSHSPSIYGAYLLLYKGVKIGYTYNIGIRAV
jgi:hypothetical protein